MQSQAVGARRWPKLIVGGILLWRALNVTALGGALELPDERFMREWSSPGINRCVRLTFSPSSCDEMPLVDRIGRALGEPIVATPARPLA